MNYYKYIASTLFILLGCILSSSAAETQQAKLSRIRHEIDSLATVLQNIQKDEKSFVNQVETLGQQISTRQRLVNELESQIYDERKAIKRFEQDIGKAKRRKSMAYADLHSINQDIEALEDLIRRRTVFVYKHGGRESMRFLLAANNPGDWFRRRIYIRRINERDRKNLLSFREAKAQRARLSRTFEKSVEELTTARDKKEAALARSENLIVEAKDEYTRLETDRDEIAGLLDEIRNNRDAVLSLIEAREKSADKVQEWVASLERLRTGGTVQEFQVGPRSSAEVIVRDIPTYSSFKDAKGELPWPVKGKILKRYGLERNTITGTLTENPGIDISAKEGDEVVAVQGGTCTRITYLRGFGTTLLVEHGNGYYTVYAHLGDIWVSEGEKIQPGRVLGTVGNSNNLGSPSLHFQIWHERKNEDPLKWLG